MTLVCGDHMVATITACATYTASENICYSILCRILANRLQSVGNCGRLWGSHQSLCYLALALCIDWSPKKTDVLLYKHK